MEGARTKSSSQKDAQFPLHFSTLPPINSGTTLLIIWVWWLVFQFHIYLTLAPAMGGAGAEATPRQPSLLLGHTLVPELSQQLHLPVTAGLRQTLKATLWWPELLPLPWWYPAFSREPDLHGKVCRRTQHLRVHMLHSVFIADSLKVEGMRDLWLFKQQKQS